MSRRDWLYILALSGCLIFGFLPASHGQDAPEPPTKAPVATKSEQQEQRANPPLAVTISGPVEVHGEKQTEPDWANPKCANPRNHDEADLCQQRDMAKAAYQTFILNVAQIIIGVLGFAALIVTICYSRQATKAAIQATKTAIESNNIAREMGQAQIRAYLSYASGTYTIGGSALAGEIVVKNFGQSPARRVRFKAALDIHSAPRYGVMGAVHVQSEPISNTVQIVQAGSEHIFFFSFPLADGLKECSHAIFDKKLDWNIVVRIEWRDIFKSEKSEDSIEFSVFPIDQPIIGQGGVAPIRAGDLKMRGT